MKYLSLLKSQKHAPESTDKTAKSPSVCFVSTSDSTFLEKNEISEKTHLPSGCPLLGGQVPDECRFEAQFFERMINEGVLPFDDIGCPLLQVCRLKR